MLTVVGTVPDKDFPLVAGEVDLDDGILCVKDIRVPVNRGTPALLAAAIEVVKALDQPLPFGYLVGDIGLGHGSRRLYEYLARQLPCSEFRTITFHYLQPDVDWHNRVLFAVEEMARQPSLIADAGFMYAAKMSGQSSKYDLFTPDAGELAFLADEKAPHPFYTRGFILQEEDRVPELISRAYTNSNAARFLLVKGKKDYLADSNGVQAMIESPLEEAMEAIGGTGDTLTGIVAALIESGINIKEASIIGARVNRLAGSLAKPTPATQIMEIIRHIPGALLEILRKERV